MAAMHFVLVHGAYHGAWCWDLLRRELEGTGHTTSAVDLPNEDPAAGAERYAGAVLAATPNTANGIVLVGHSLGGLTIPIVAGRIRTRMAIYLCALIPVPGLSFDAQHADFDTGFRPSETAVANPDGSASWPERGAIEVFYHDCDPEIAIASAQRLRRQQWRITQEVTPLREWPSVPSAYITCADDRVVSKAYSGRAARELLQVESIEMPGGHSPFLSRPKELARQMLRAAIA
jgi:pimeloyl-ACP methyl ester carboxylesterase